MRHGSCRFQSGSLGTRAFALGGLGVHSGLLGSRGCALLVNRFIRGRWVHWGAPWGSLGSSGFAGFIDMRPDGRWEHPMSLGSLR